MRTDAMQYGIQEVARRLAPDHRYRMRETSDHCLPEDVEATMTRVSNRYGVPEDAETFLIQIEGNGFSVRAQAV